MKLLKTISFLLAHLLPMTWIRKLSPRGRLILEVTTGASLVILIPLALGLHFGAQKAEAVWFDDNYSYRQTVALTNSGTAQTDYQISITLDTATLVTAGKMQSDCDDIRVTDINGKVLPYWIETGTNACNTATTAIWTKVPSISTTGNTLYIYYGNPTATSRQNGDTTFVFFDDFSGGAINTAKWTTGTIAATTGTDWSVSGGNLNGGNNNRYIQSVGTFTGDYTVQSRSYTTTDNANGFSVVGFWASINDNFGILDHDNTSFYRNDSSWVNFAIDGTGQWTKNIAKVVGTTATYTRTGETSGSATATGITNSGISAEGVRLGSRYDSSNYDQNYVATWDWVFVKKAATTEPSVASPASEEKATSPVAYWKFDDGTGTNAQDATTNNNDGTVSGATWQTEDQCVSGKCLYFNGTTSYINAGNGSSVSLSTAVTTSAWIKLTGTPNASHGSAVISKGISTDGNAASYELLLLSDFSVYARIYTTSAINAQSSANAVARGQWAFVTMTYDKSNLKVFVNGVQVASTASTNNLETNSGNLTIGVRSFQAGPGPDSEFPGFIDEPKVYNYTRSAAQIQADYNARANNEGGSGVLGASNNQPSALSNGLAGYWKMDESSWTQDCSTATATDSSGNSNTGKSCPSTTGPTTGAGKFGNGGVFDGSNDYVSVADNTAFDFGTGPMTVSAWMKTSQTTNEAMVVDSTNNTTNSGFFLDYRGDSTDYIDARFCASLACDSTSNSGETMSDGLWHHLLLTRDGTNVKLFVDGVLKSTTTDNRKNITNTNALAIGAQSDGDGVRFNGSIDDVRLYNRGLSSADAATLYNFAPGPVSYWTFDEGTGTTTADKSTNASTATLQAGANWANGKYGKAANLDGSNDYISATIAGATQSFTVSGWYNSGGNSSSNFLWESTGVSAPSIEGNDSGQVFWMNNSNQASLGAMTAGRWYYVSATYDAGASTQRVYLDGVLKATNTSVSEDDINTTIYVGSRGGSSGFWKGKVDDFKIYNYARTQGQIIEDMNAGHPAPGSPVGTPVGHWKFDEGADGTCSGGTNDACNSGSQGSTLDGAESGMAVPATSTSGWTQSGKFGRALNFDGTNDYVTVPDNNAIDFTGSFTLGAWVKNTSGAAIIMAKRPTADDANYVFVDQDVSGSPKLQLQWYNPSTTARSLSASDAYARNTWHHMVVTYDSVLNQVRFYVDGRPDSANPQTPAAGFLANSGALTIGVQNEALLNGYFTGQIDEVKIYGQALTAEQVKLDMNRGSSQVLGALSDNSSYQAQAANQEYCVPGDATSCAAPVGRWDFEEGTSTVANDTSGNANTGTWNGTGSHWKPGKVGKGGNFNGTDDYVDAGNASNLQITTGTIEAWIKTSNAGSSYRGIVTKQLNYGIFLKDNVFILYDWFASADRSTSINLGDGNWHHVAASFQSGTTNGTILYIDGVSKLTTTMTTSNNTVAVVIGAGNPGTGQNFTGQIDQGRIFNYVRTPAQVAWDYNKGGPVGWWKMDECQGTVANDSSGNSNTGTITIGATGTYTSAGTCPSGTATHAWAGGVAGAGKRNYALSFDGTDDKVTVGSMTVGTNMTIAGWIKKTASTGQKSFFSNRGGGGVYFGLSGTSVFMYDNAGTPASALSSSGAVTIGQWQHVVATSDGTTTRFYVNGVPLPSISQTRTSSTGTVGIGWDPSIGTEYWDGQIDDARIYNYALTATQVKSLYTGGALNFAPTTGAP